MRISLEPTPGLEFSRPARKIQMRFLTPAILGVGLLAIAACTSDTAAPPGSHSLAVILAGDGSGTVASSPEGIDCGETCTADFDHGSSVILIATPQAGSTFGGWKEGRCSGTEPCEISLVESSSVTASFEVP